jgi:hypothetical protein
MSLSLVEQRQDVSRGRLWSVEGIAQLEHCLQSRLQPPQALVGRQLQVLAPERPIDVTLENLDDRIGLEGGLAHSHVRSVPASGTHAAAAQR